MEPHAAIAAWEPDGQAHRVGFHPGAVGRPGHGGQGPGPAARTRSGSSRRHVGGGFGAKGTTRPHAILAALAARAVRRPVKVAMTRQQMFDLTGYRTPTIQRIALGAAADGRLTADLPRGRGADRDDQRVRRADRGPHPGHVRPPALRTTHRLARLNVPTPSWMRAPGEAPGMFALESAMDELALAAGIDPVELRIRNEPQAEPDSGLPFSSRNLVACLREGARRFGWAGPGSAAPDAPRRTVADRHRGGRLHLPGPPRGHRPPTSGLTGDGFEVRIAAVGHRHRGAHRTDRDRRARPRPSRPIRSGSNSATARCLRAVTGGRLDGHCLHGARPSSRPARTC